MVTPPPRLGLKTNKSEDSNGVEQHVSFAGDSVSNGGIADDGPLGNGVISHSVHNGINGQDSSPLDCKQVNMLIKLLFFFFHLGLKEKI